MTRTNRTCSTPRRGFPAGRGRRGLVLGTLLLALLGATWSAAFGAGTPEYQVKAAFLYNFIKFVEWPGDSFSSPGVITLGILGRDPFGAALDEIRDKSAKGRRVTVRHLHSVEEAKECDLVFVCASEKGRLPQIVRFLQSSPVLTVADHEGFCQAGGMINFIFLKNKLGFEVNLGAANRARLKLSSQLLRLGRVVQE